MSLETDFERLTREELLAKLESLLTVDRAAGDRERLVTELQVQQGELEVQNRELRDVQGALEESRNRYADLYDFAPVAYFTFDETGVVREVNLTGATMIGRDRLQVLGAPFHALVCMEDITAFWSHLRQCSQARARVVSEFSFATSRRERVDVEAVSVPVIDPGGRLRAFRTAFTDIGARKMAETERRRALDAEKRLRERLQALDTAQQAVARSLVAPGGIDEVLRVVVEQACAITQAQYGALGVGTTPGEPFTPWVFSGMPPERVAALGRTPRIVATLATVVREGQPLRLKDVREHPDFAGFPPHHPPMKSLLAVPIRHVDKMLGNLFLTNKQGAEAFTEEDQQSIEMLAERAAIGIAIARLIAERDDRAAKLRVSEQALRETSDRFRLLAENAPDIVFRVNPSPSPSLEYISPACTVVTGYTPEELLADPEIGFKLIHPDDRALLEAQTRSGREGELTYRWIRRDGAVIWIHQHSVPILDETGRVVAIEGIARDVTERKQAEVEREQLLATAQAAVRSQEILLAIVSHDLRSPLNALALSAGLLARSPSTLEDPRAAKNVDRIRRSAERMNRLIEDLLTATTLEAGRLTVAPRPEDPCALIEEALQLAAPLFENTEILLERQLPAALPAILGDRARLLQVFANLLGNAIKFTPPGGRIEVGARHEGQEIRFAISDSGPGIAPQEVEHLFDRYWRGSSDGGSGTGVGLGLYISKGIVEALGGRIWVDTTPGEGTRFYFTLPLATFAEEPVEGR